MFAKKSVGSLTLVTGGAGFIGSHLVDELLARGDQVIIADNLRTGSLRNVDAALRTGRATFVYADIDKPLAELRDVLLKAAQDRRVDRIFHFASAALPERSRRGISRSNAVVELAMEHGSQLIYATTARTSMSSSGNRRSDSSIENPVRACYSEGNRTGDVAELMGTARKGFDVRALRLFDCYGPRMPVAAGRLIRTLADAILTARPIPISGEGGHLQSVSYVDDVIRLIMRVAEMSRVESELIDISSDHEHRVFDIADAIARVAGVALMLNRVPPRPVNAIIARPDLRRVRSIGYVPGTPLAQGLMKTIAWLRSGAVAYV